MYLHGALQIRSLTPLVPTKTAVLSMDPDGIHGCTVVIGLVGSAHTRYLGIYLEIYSSGLRCVNEDTLPCLSRLQGCLALPCRSACPACLATPRLLTVAQMQDEWRIHVTKLWLVYHCLWFDSPPVRGSATGTVTSTVWCPLLEGCLGPWKSWEGCQGMM